MDLFEYTAEKLKNNGMDLAADAQERNDPGAAEIAYQTICKVARRQATVHVDDVQAACPVQLAHCNAWGSVWRRAMRDGVIAPTGTVRKCTFDPAKHSRMAPIYRSLVNEVRS